MLSESLIKEFRRNSPSTRVLLDLAWPSLSVESKLQILVSYTKVDFGDSIQHVVPIPEWLQILAMEDGEEIIRVFGMMFGGVDSSSDIEKDILIKSVYDSEHSKSVQEIEMKINAEENKIIRSIKNNAFSFFDDLKAIPQQSRLISIRGIGEFRLDIFLACFNQLILEIPKEQLIEMLDEIIENYTESGICIPTEIEELNQAWELIAKVDEDLSFRLAKITPIKAGSTRWITAEVKAEQLLKVPPMAIFWAFKSNLKHPTKELHRAANLILETKGGVYDEHLKDIAWKLKTAEEAESWEVANNNNIHSKKQAGLFSKNLSWIKDLFKFKQ